MAVYLPYSDRNMVPNSTLASRYGWKADYFMNIYINFRSSNLIRIRASDVVVTILYLLCAEKQKKKNRKLNRTIEQSNKLLHIIKCDSASTKMWMLYKQTAATRQKRLSINAVIPFWWIGCWASILLRRMDKKKGSFQWTNTHHSWSFKQIFSIK